MSRIADLVAAHTRDVADFPEPGVVFKDFSPLLRDAAAFGEVTAYLSQTYRDRVDVIAGIDARGFIIGAALAQDLGLGFVPIRKAGKLPGPVLHLDYALEYGTAAIELPADAFAPGQRVLVVDDVLATGGTAEAAVNLVEQAGGRVVDTAVVIELGFLGGRARLGDRVTALWTV